MYLHSLLKSLRVAWGQKVQQTDDFLRLFDIASLTILDRGYSNQNMYRRYLPALLLIVLTVAVFLQVRDHGFVWDDRVNVKENPHLNPATPASVLQFWEKPYESLYVPLTYSVWASIAPFARSEE